MPVPRSSGRRVPPGGPFWARPEVDTARLVIPSRGHPDLIAADDDDSVTDP